MPFIHDPRITPTWPGFDPRASQDIDGGELASPATIPERRLNPREIFFPDFIDSIQHSPDFLEFALPFSENLNWFRNQAWDLRHLPRPDLTPMKFVSHLATNFRFPLIDVPFAEDRERRLLVAEVFSLYRRRGTLWAVQRLCEILGFTVTLEEAYKVSWLYNRHRLWGFEGITTSETAKDFDSGTMEDFVNEAQGHGYNSANKLRMVGESGYQYTTEQSANIEDTRTDYLLQTDFEFVSGSSIYAAINIIWQDADHVVRVYLVDQSGVFVVGVAAYESQAPTIWTGAVAPNSFAFETGQHKVTIWDSDSILSVFVDNWCAFQGYNYAAKNGADWQRVKKGFMVSDVSQVDFDNFSLRSFESKAMPRTYSPSIHDKTLYITLSGSPSHEAAKREYLGKVVPRFFAPINNDVVIL